MQSSIVNYNNRQSKIFNHLLGCNIQTFNYGINGLHNPDSLVFRGIPDTGASDPLFGAD
jgi:hypothetical protein